MYNLHVENKKTKKKKKTDYKKMADSFLSSWKSIQFTNENINKNIIQTTVWFSASRKKKKGKKKWNIILTTKS